MPRTRTPVATPPPAAPPAGPPRVSAATTPPRPLTAFVGRQRELEEIERLLGESRLLTLCGAGGSGKTRLAIETVERVAPRHAGGVAWVDLTTLTDPRLVAQQVASALGIHEEGSASPVDALVGLLQRREILLVLDNCEHLVEAAAELADVLLRRCPALTILATSREPLAVGGERAWLVPPLTLPAERASADDAYATSEAIHLFVDRARDVVAHFALTAANVHAVAEICRRLDGIPLAIELAAARVRALSPEQIAARLDDAFALLTTGGRTALPRHRTLRATMDWSYRLLSPAEQALLARLGVFGGGFTLEAVEAICAGGAVAADDVLDALAQLVDRSMVAVRERDTSARYHLLETVRQYALEHLEASGEADAVRRAHAEYFVQAVEIAGPALTTTERRPRQDQLEAEVDNLRLALAWTLEHAPALHVRLSGLLCWFWYSSRHWAEGRRWFERALALPEAAAPSPDRAAVLLATGILATLQGDSARAREMLEESVALTRRFGDAHAEAYAKVYLGMTLAATGSSDGRALCREAGEWFRGANDLYGLRLAQLILSTSALLEGNVREAVAFAEEGVACARFCRQDRELAISIQSLASAVIVAGEHDRAAGLVQHSIELLQRDPSYLFLARALELLALLECVRVRWREGVLLFGAADAVRETIGARHFRIDEVRYAPYLAGARQALGDRGFDEAWREGRALPLEAALERALRLPHDGNGAAAEAYAPACEMVAIPAEAVLRVQALGPLVIQVGDRALEDAAWRYARPRELLLYLLAHPDGRTREQIGLAFWPDATAAQVKNNFHVTLHHLRKALGRADAVVIEGERYRVNPALNAWLDAHAFAQQLREALRSARAGQDVREALARALALYRGDFLAGASAGDWHLELHDHLRRLAADGLSALARAHLAAGEPAQAIPVLERLVRLEELSEEAHRQLMEAYAASGERGRALRHYADLVAFLRKEIEGEPERETTALYDRIRQAG